jgi:hypothetical protein
LGDTSTCDHGNFGAETWKDPGKNVDNNDETWEKNMVKTRKTLE